MDDDIIRIPSHPDSGLTEPTQVRTTTIDGKRMVAAIDVIKLVVTGNAPLYWFRAVRAYPGLLNRVKRYKFTGQRDTPVLDAPGVVILLNVLSGRSAENFRPFCDDGSVHE